MKKMILLAVTVMSTAFVFAQNNTKDEQAVRTAVQTLETGWNQKSGETFASVFADVHDYIVVNGLYFSGFTRQGNAAAHQILFDGVYKNADVKIKVDKLNFHTSNLVMVYAMAARYEKDKSAPEDPSAIMTILLEKKNNDWKIISFHNHEININELKERGPMPMNVMFASWYK